MALGIVAFVVAILISVMIHEAGHFVTARMFGMKATQFFVGFGPTLWSRQRGETEYGVKAIPAGGFVKIVGMTPLEEVAPEDQPRALINKPGWQRFIVLVAGSTMHFVIALVLFFTVMWGWPSKDDHYARIAEVFACAMPDANGACPAGAAPAPAEGVLQRGDVILAVDGTNVSTARVVDPQTQEVTTGGQDAAVGLVKASSGPVRLTIKRDGSVMNVVITPAVVGGGPRLGVAVGAHFARVGPLAAAGAAASAFGTGVTQSFSALGHVPHELGQLLSNPHAQRSATSSGGQVTSVVGVAHIAGQAFQSDGFSGGVATLILIVGSVNLFIGLFNLFPLLPLDGGHVAILGYEKTRDWWRRRQGRPAAGPVDLTKLMPVTYAALALIVGMSMILLYADVTNPVANPFQ